MKERKRYIVFELLYDSDLEINEKQVVKKIANQLLRLYGEVGASKTHFWLHIFDNKNKKGLIECRNDAINILRSTLASITHIDTIPIIFNTIGVSGTIKAAKKKYLLQNNISQIEK